MVLLANALDLYPPAVQGGMIQRLLAIAASMDRWGVMEALADLADLTPSVRANLFKNQATVFRHLVEIAEATVDQVTIAGKLEVELHEAENRRASLERRLRETIEGTAEAEQACARPIRSAQTCLARNMPSTTP